MKLSKYLKDRAAGLVISAFALIISIIFLLAFRVDFQVLVLVSVIFVASAVVSTLWDYYRKKDFYQRLEASLRELDKKYLLSEMMEDPDFIEGKILMDTLVSANKSMADHVSDYRRMNSEFRDYIEMWVHEIKIPVSGLRLMCHNENLDPGKMTGELRRIDDYIDNVLYYARAENAEKDYIIKEVSLQKTFGAAAVKNREALQLMGADIEADGLDLMVLTDGKWLKFIFGQLFDNSMKYRAKERPLKIRVSAEDLQDRTLIRFTDNGIGIAREDIPYVFDKSFTGKNGRKGAHSTGMGMYIVKHLCRRLGHEVEVSSVEGESTTVTITFGKNDYYSP